MNLDAHGESDRLLAAIELAHHRIPKATVAKVIELHEALDVSELAAHFRLRPAVVRLILQSAPPGAKP